MYDLQMTELSDFQRGGVVALEKVGHSHLEIGKILEIPSSTVSTTIRRFKATGSAASCPRTGRPPKITARGQQKVLRDISDHPNRSWTEIAVDFDVCSSAIQQVAKSDGLSMRKARKKPFLTPPQSQKRLEWAHANFHTDWRSVAFTDEAAVESGVRKGASFTIRRVGEEFQEKHMVPTFKQKRKSVMVWGAVALGRKWPLVRLEHDAFYDGKNAKNGIMSRNWEYDRPNTAELHYLVHFMSQSRPNIAFIASSLLISIELCSPTSSTSCPNLVRISPS